jgi:hypothetical protein
MNAGAKTRRIGRMDASSYYFLPPLGLLFCWLLLGEHVALGFCEHALPDAAARRLAGTNVT